MSKATNIIVILLVTSAVIIFAVNNQMARVAQAQQERDEKAEIARAKKRSDAEKAVTREQERQDRAARKKIEDENCKKDWKCWAEKNSLAAIVKCQEWIEKKSKYDFQWTDGWLEPKFSIFKRAKTDGAFTYIGDKIKFQNQYGAWQRMTYQCDYQVDIGEVFAVRVLPGRIQ